jgi:hypothetical protein
MKKLLIASVVFAIVTYGVFSFWPGAPRKGSLLDVLPGILSRKDTIELVRLERAIDSLAIALHQQDSVYAEALRETADSLAAAQGRSSRAAVVASRLRVKADSIARLLTKAREDDDSLPILVTLVQAKDSVITAVTTERDAAIANAIFLTRTLARRDSLYGELRIQFAEAIRQRDAYRKRGKRDWLTAAVLVGGTMALCNAVSNPC